MSSNLLIKMPLLPFCLTSILLIFQLFLSSFPRFVNTKYKCMGSMKETFHDLAVVHLFFPSRRAHPAADTLFQQASFMQSSSNTSCSLSASFPVDVSPLPGSFLSFFRTYLRYRLIQKAVLVLLL